LTRLSEVVQQNVLDLEELRRARCVALYAAMPLEVSTDILIRNFLAEGKVVLLPRTVWSERRMDMVRVSDPDTDLAPGPKGIMEPIGEEIIAPGDIDLVIVPGRAFDRSCNRVGQGGGFYDSFLAGTRQDCVRCAPAFGMQIFDSVPVQAHDLPVDIVVTEKDIYRRS
jgi:5-formyltetrahydrofolate cyclo-ligase